MEPSSSDDWRDQLEEQLVHARLRRSLGAEWDFEDVPADLDEVASTLFTALHRKALTHTRVGALRSLGLSGRRCRLGLMLLDRATKPQAAVELGVSVSTVSRDLRELRALVESRALESVIAEASEHSIFVDDDPSTVSGNDRLRCGQQHA